MSEALEILVNPVRFIREVLDYQVESLHEKILWHVISQDRTIDLAPRGFGKSTIGSVAYTIWRIVQDRNIRILIVSNTQRQAEAFIREVKTHLEWNEKLINLYGAFQTDRKWTDSELLVSGRMTIKKESTLTALGASGAVTSKHFSMIIADDVVDFENARTQLQRERLVDWYYSALLPTLEPGGELHIQGTRYHPLDLYQTLFDTGEYNTQTQRAISLEGTSLWPAKFSIDELLRKKAESGSRIFACQYQNDVDLMKQGSIFQYQWFQFYSPEQLPPREALKIYMGCDLAIAKTETADYSVFMVIGISRTKDIYVLDIVRDRLSFLDQLKAIQVMAARWDPIRIGIESNAYQVALPQTLKSTTHLPIKEIITIKDKVTRAQTRSALFENGKVFIRKEMTVFIDELCLFPDAQNDDTFDAFDLALTAEGTLNQDRFSVVAKRMNE